MSAVRVVAGQFLGTEARFETVGHNVFHLDLEGAEKGWGARLVDGRIFRHRVYRRGANVLPNIGVYGFLISETKTGTDVSRLVRAIQSQAARTASSSATAAATLSETFLCLEAMVADGWVRASRDPSLPVLSAAAEEGGIIHPNRDVVTSG